jgi:hypothetical protein
MSPPKISIREDGTLLEPALHDAKLLGILTFESKRALLISKVYTGEIKGLWLVDVERLNATNFYGGNIILDCTVESGPRADCNEAFKGLGLAGDKGAETYLETLRGRIGRFELKIVTINPSYGCEFCALCREVESWDGQNDGSGLLSALIANDSLEAKQAARGN